MNMRKMCVAGSFYPAESNSILRMIDHFNAILKDHPDELKRFDTLSGNAVIVPHAGWVYSGFTANIAHRILSYSQPSTVVLIGPSHRIGFDGISIANSDTYETPLGDLNMDKEMISALKEYFALPYYPQAHKEHSTEVQAPFIKYYLPNTKVVELVYAYSSPARIQPIIEYALQQNNTSVIISTDLSHYYSLEEANRLDAICLNAIRTENVDELHQGCEACGLMGVEAMIGAARSLGMQSLLLDYRTSADASGDTSRVVGYASALFYRNDDEGKKGL